jgi:hypothetical protein
MSKAESIVLNHPRVHHESERMWKEVFMTNFKVLGLTEEKYEKLQSG